MLDELAVSNLGLIEGARLDPGPGLVVVTGETGAGKTLLLGALRLLLGAPARRDLVGPAGDEAVVQARFLVGDEEIAVARRITGGRSRAYVDGLVAPAKTLEARTGGLVELVAQHDHLRLTRVSEVRRMVDGMLDAEGERSLARYREAWDRFATLTRRREALGGDQRTLERELETCRHQVEEIDAAGFTPGDDIALASTAGRLRNTHGLLELLGEASRALGEGGAETPLDAAVTALQRVADLDPELKGVAEQAVDVSSLAGELRAEVTAAAERIDSDPASLAEVEERLSLLADLRRKYGDRLEDILEFAERARRRADELAALLGEADGLDGSVTEAASEVADAGTELAVAHRRAGETIAASASRHLTELGFRDPVVAFAVEETPPGPHGTDRIELRFASDAALEPAPVARVASGGELSRLVLALRLATGAGEAPVAAFDEIDAGVGGAVALSLGRKLADLARRRQVLAVTHLPQVAAFADDHYVVRRHGTSITVEPVTGEARIEELSRMLAGMPESDRGREHAAELVALATGHGGRGEER